MVMAGQEDSSAPPQDQEEEEEVSNVQLALDFLQGFRNRVPSSIDQAGKGFYDSLLLHGLRVEHVGHGHITCSVGVHLRITNAGGSLHGGAIASFVDIIGSAAIHSTGMKSAGSSVDINVSFMSSAPADEEVEIDAKTLRVGKNLAVVSVDFRNKVTGELIAQGRQTRYLGNNFPTSKL